MTSDRDKVLAEVKSIQAMAPDGMPVWFKVDAIVKALGIERGEANEALYQLCARGDVTSSLIIEDGVARLVYKLSEVAESGDTSQEAP